jgi:copper chaperone CopZ
MSTVFDVKNIHCQSCSKRIVAAVQSVHPDSQVTIEVEAGRVTVQPTVMDVSGVISAIAEAGYEARAAA